MPIAYFSSIMIPSYTFVFPFSKIEDAYEYNFPGGELIYKKQYKNTVFVYGRNSSNLYYDAVTFFTKEKGKWICHRYQKDFRKGESCAFVEQTRRPTGSTCTLRGRKRLRSRLFWA